ncbi:hypothetical protein [Granulicella arctica]|uniref:hypothetical protein n=1 Tax=Granulicella arctica TaxID=940613 RepID=UPI0021E019A6|nr:hypothetical protein [Granulicella arctica]
MDRVRGSWNRRQFIQAAGTTAALAGVEARARAVPANTRSVFIIIDPADPVASAPAALWAAKQLEDSLSAHGVIVSRFDLLDRASTEDLCILATGSTTFVATQILQAAAIEVPKVHEALGLASGTIDGRKVLLACGYDIRGLVYALLDLSDRVQNAPNAIAALTITQPLAERPANQVRSITRLFTSDVEDKPWYNDREMWKQYLTMLAANRFNRFNLAFGIGYDFIRQVTDAYFLFTYPFMLAVPGYNVRVPQLSDAERDSNLAMLRFISEETVARGMEFSVGLWMHGYEWIDSPNPNYTIEGLTHKTHGPYCRDAVRMLLKECPSISGVTFRIHGESGVSEGSYEFWKTVFDGVATCGRKIEIDMHAKGMDQTMTDIAIATQQPVAISPKFWAEHMGMSYHQADIRELEQPKPGEEKTGLMKLSTGTRSFLRYGHGDLLRDDRKYSVVHRIWPGTQRLLLWGDPVTGAQYSKAFSFCGSNGVEICEPLSFKGRRGSGHAGNRTAYTDLSLSPRWDWQKYAYSYRIWGRLLYNPDAAPAVWQRSLHHEFGPGAPDVEAALANASRILPIITTAHGASAGNNTYWPEVYYNQSMVDSDHPGPYTDSPSPKVFGNVSPLDPQLFSRMSDFAAELVDGNRSGKYTPVEVAQWLEDLSAEAQRHLKRANVTSTNRTTPEYRRMAIDVSLQAALGSFFATKFRSGVLFEIYKKTNDQAALKASLIQYRQARDIWADLANQAKGVYMSDITVGEQSQLRGHWLDRLPAIDKDIAAVALRVDSSTNSPAQPSVALAIREALGRPVRHIPAIKHEAPGKFHPGQPLQLSVSLPQPGSAVHLYYRHVDQAERYTMVPMEVQGAHYAAAIPASYTDSEYPLEYYFEVKQEGMNASLYPGFSKNLASQPYFIALRM